MAAENAAATVADEAPLATADTLRAAVSAAVRGVRVVDLHTHLFPPSHGTLMLWGIDALLTYHYLIAELFTVIPPSELTPEQFHALPGGAREQADVIWRELFVKRTPLSEACRGVLTTLSAFGLGDAMRAKDLDSIRKWFDAQSPEEHVRNVFELAGVRYAVMTNVPFDPEEARHWGAVRGPERAADADAASGSGAAAAPIPDCLKSALRVDPLLTGDWDAISAALRATGFACTLDGARQYLRAWAAVMKPEYLMASTPAGFVVDDPGVYRDDEEFNDDPPSGGVLMRQVLIPVAEELSLPLAVKVGAARGVNPRLKSGGDGVEVADLSFIAALCSEFPRVKLLVTVLSRTNQHELAVLARKFGNLHVYGCWWFCNTPSIIRETTTMRMELLGTAFTAQHSDARVLDQLVYKWRHNRAVVAEVLAEQYIGLMEAGWVVTRSDVERDAELLLGGSYEAFLAK